MNNIKDLTKGSIIKTLVNLAIPIIGTSFIQMAYNMIDMFWIGNTGSDAVAAIGTAGFFIWLGQSFMIISKTGVEIGVAQSVGKKDKKEANKYMVNSIKLNIFLSLIYSIFLIVFRKNLIAFFNLGSETIISMATSYLAIVSFGIIFNFMSPILTGIFNGFGDSKTPFIINTIGLLFNIIFDPLLIYGYGPFMKLGVMGAAIATVLAQILVIVLFIYALKKRKELNLKIDYSEKLDKKYIRKIVKLGLPVAIQNAMFCLFSMIIARVIAYFGPSAIAVQKVGSQIEAISWMSAGGLSTALGAFVGQNYGARKWHRIYKGYFLTLTLALIIGGIASLILIFGGEYIFKIFIKETEAIKMGGIYLQIVGYSQIFMCLEITTAGAFNGLSKTLFPSVVSVIFTGLRIPFAIILSKYTSLALNGVWWSISISSIVKGVLLASLLIFLVLIPKRKELKLEIE